jgi:homoserine kinase
MSEVVTAFAPASIGNVGVGFDMLGLALEGAGDRVIARRIPGNDIVVAEVRGLDGELHPHLSTKVDENTASIAAQALWREHGDGSGVELKVHKGVPLQSGMGSSAASAVAAVVAVNALLENPLEIDALLPYALEGEKFASDSCSGSAVAPDYSLAGTRGCERGSFASGPAGQHGASQARTAKIDLDATLAGAARSACRFHSCLCEQ